MLLALLVSYVALTSALQIGTPFASQAAPSARLACRTRHPDVVCGRKGRPKMPGGGGAFAQPQQRQPEPSPDGMPNFYLYCRSGPGKPWYPVSMMKGDGQSKGLINAWLGSPVAKDVFKNRLDEGMARSIFDSERRLAKMAGEQYSHVKTMKGRLEWGFKIIYNELSMKEAAGEIEKQKIVPVSRDMIKEGNPLQNALAGAVDNAKKSFNL